MKRILLSMAVGLSCFSAQAETQAPDAMIKDVAQEVIVIIKQDAGSKAENQKKILLLHLVLI